MTVAEHEKHPIAEQLRRLSSSDPHYAVSFVDVLLRAAVQVRASDVHLQPTSEGLDLQWRLDGMLHQLGSFASGTSSDIVTRLKVLADLLTYRTDAPQEGRIRNPSWSSEMRVSTYPTLFGERAVVRIFSAANQLMFPRELGLPDETLNEWNTLLSQSSGVLVISGPAGSGKTTTAYASLREMLRAPQGVRSILTIEDPIEVPLPGAAQAQVSPAFDLSTALRSALRQDPEVLLVGEIRDPDVARGVFNAALTGHLVLSTLHAGSASQAVCRLADMGIEPYLMHSGLRAVLNQRLARRLCRCARETSDSRELLGLPVSSARIAVGCPDCQQTGYAGRVLITEFLILDSNSVSRTAIHLPDREWDAASLERHAVQAGMIPLRQRGIALVGDGTTSPVEFHRVLGDVGLVVD